MSSANGSQNLFTNIFRPVYRYEIPVGGSTAMFTPSVDVCNIDVLSANSVSAFTAAIGDANENVYVGSNAGNDYSNLRGCSNVTALGFAAASLVSNVTNSVYVGYNSGAGATDSSVNVAIGPNTKGNGVSNIYIGSNTGSLGTGFNNILIGHNLTGTNLSNTLLIGPTPTIYGNLSTRKVGIGRDPSYNMDVSGDSRISYRLGIGMAPGSAVGLSNLPHALDVSGFSYINGALGINADPADYTMNVNGRFNVDDGNGSLRLTSDGSGNSVIEARPRGGKKLIFNIQGDLCATAIIIPGASYTGNVTASNLISSNDISGPMAHVTNIYGNTVYGTDVSGATARFATLYASTFAPAAISVGTLSAGNGTASAPSITFSNDISSGIYLVGSSNVAFTTAGVERMRISNTNVGIGTNVPRSALDVSTNIRAGTPGNTTNTARLEVGGGYDSTGAAVANSYPTLAMQFGDSAGGYRHFVRSRHNAAVGDAGNAVDIFTNNSATATASTAPGTSNLLGLSITSAGVGVGTSNPAVALDVSGALRSTAATSNSVGGVTLSNGNLIPTTVRNATIPTTFDISGGNISNSGTTVSTTFRNAATGFTVDISGGNVVTSNVLASGYVRNALVPTQFDISGGNMSNSGTIISVGGIRNAAAAWTIDISGGNVVTSNVLASGYVRNALVPTQFDISGGNISNSGTHTASNFVGTATASNTIGGVVLSNGNVIPTAIRNATIPTTFDISGGNISNSATTVSATFRNAVNGFTTDISGGTLATSNAIISNYLRNALIPTQFDISGGNISNSGTHTTSNLLAPNGYIRSTIGGSIGVDISGGQALVAGGLTVSNGIIAPGSNVFGGTVLNGNNATLPTVLLNSNLILNAGTAAIRDAPGGFTYDISSGNFRGVAGSVSNPTYAFVADPSAGLYRPGAGQFGIAVGGVQRLVVSNSNVGIGRVLPSATLDVSGDVSANGFLASAYVRNAIVPSTLDISGGNISNSGTIVSVGGIRNATSAWTIDISRGSIRGGAGAVSNPTYAFTTDTSAGLYSLGTNQIGIASAGLNRMVISNSNIGVNVLPTNSLLSMDVSGRIRIVADGSTSLTSFGLNTGTDSLVIQHTGSYLTAADLGKSASILFANAISNYPQARIASEMTGVTPGNYGANLILQTNAVGGSLVERMRIHSNGNVGIGTTAPNGILDISGGPANVLIGSTNGSDGLLIQSSTNTGGAANLYSYIRNQASGGTVVLGGSNQNSFYAGRTGVGVFTTPSTSYALDISASPGTNASINMNTWTRTTGSISYYGVYASVATNSVTWTTSNSMDSNLITVGVNNGTYFTVNRSGIYSINAYINGGVGLAIIDVSTVITHTGFSSTTTPQLAVASSGAGIGQMNVTYTGFLPSNANNYYKIKINTAPSAGYSGGRLYITFLGESPNVPGIPY